MCVPVMGLYLDVALGESIILVGNVVFVDYQAGEFVGDSVIVKLA